MKTPSEEKRWLDEPRNVTKIFYGLVTVCALLVVAGFFLPVHGHFGFEEWPAFYGLFGFVAYVGLVLTAKQLRKLLKRPEDYYSEEPHD